MTRARPWGDGGPFAGGRGGPGLIALVPGAAQWVGGQRERGAFFAGSFAAAAVTAAFTWGTPLSLALVGFAFVTHVAATADVVRRSAFPGFRRGAVLTGAAVGLGVGGYAPLLALASLLAWPGLGAGEGDGFLVDCRAYRRDDPRRDELVWYRPTPWAAPRVGRVVAGVGQDVEWAGGVLRIDGRVDRRGAVPRVAVTPKTLAYRVPDGHVLVRAEGGGVIQRSPVDGLAMVARDQVLGRPWARLYPVRERRLL